MRMHMFKVFLSNQARHLTYLIINSKSAEVHQCLLYPGFGGSSTSSSRSSRVVMVQSRVAV